MQAWNRGVSFMLHTDNAIAKRVEMVDISNDDLYRPAREVETFNLSIEAAQDLINQLWGLGMRPTQKVGYEGQLEAVKYHLEDMRKLVFDANTKRVIIQKGSHENAME